MSDSNTLLTFPTEFTLKTFGRMTVEFEGSVVSIMKKHLPKLGEAAIQTRPSKGNKFLSLSITFIAESKEQLDAIYSDLTTSPDILMVL